MGNTLEAEKMDRQAHLYLHPVPQQYLINGATLLCPVLYGVFTVNMEFLNYRTIHKGIHLLRNLLPHPCFRSRQTEAQEKLLHGCEALPRLGRQWLTLTFAGSAPIRGLQTCPLA